MTRVCIDKGAVSPCDCKNFMKGIRTINGQYPDDNREFGILEGTGIIISPETAGIRIACTVPTADTVVAGDNIDISPGGDNELVISLASDPEIPGNLQVDGTTVLNDDLQVNGDIIQNGASYETHAEKVYTTNDYIITRDGAISALSAGDYSGFQVTKYDGTNDGRLVMDKDGTARVGDVGDEQPLLTRDESDDLTNGQSLVWDSANSKAITQAIPSAISTALNGKQSNITIVNSQVLPTNQPNAVVSYNRYGRIVTINFFSLSCVPGVDQVVATDFPIPSNPNVNFTLSNPVGQNTIHAHIDSTGRFLISSNGVTETQNLYGTVTYMITE